MANKTVAFFLRENLQLLVCVAAVKSSCVDGQSPLCGLLLLLGRRADSRPADVPACPSDPSVYIFFNSHCLLLFLLLVISLFVSWQPAACSLLCFIFSGNIYGFLIKCGGKICSVSFIILRDVPDSFFFFFLFVFRYIFLPLRPEKRA